MTHETIHSKEDLLKWLVSKGHSYSLEDLPEVVPLRATKWMELENPPEWVCEYFYLSSYEYGNDVRCLLDVEQQKDTIRLKFVNGLIGSNFFKEFRKLKPILMDAQTFSSIKSLADLIDYLQRSQKTQYKLNLEE